MRGELDLRMSPLKRRSPARKRAAKTWETYVKAQARRIWGWSEMRKAVKRRTEVANGLHRCEECSSRYPWKGNFDVDHVDPVEKITGWDGDWTGYFKRMFIHEDHLRGLCTECHKAKTVAENKLRVIARADKKKQTTEGNES